MFLVPANINPSLLLAGRARGLHSHKLSREYLTTTEVASFEKTKTVTATQKYHTYSHGVYGEKFNTRCSTLPQTQANKQNTTLQKM
jgi:hypothetical protein